MSTEEVDMSLPALYEEGLMQRSVRGSTAPNAYKLGLIEALLKETLSPSPP